MFLSLQKQRKFLQLPPFLQRERNTMRASRSIVPVRNWQGRKFPISLWTLIAEFSAVAQCSLRMKQCKGVAEMFKMMLWWLQITDGKWMMSVTKMSSMTCHHSTAMPQTLLVDDDPPLANWCEELLRQCYFLAEGQVFSNPEMSSPLLIPCWHP